MLSERARNLLILSAVVLVASVGLFCLWFFIKQDYSLVGWMNACFFSGVVVLLSGLLALATHWGAFDMLGYGIRYIGWGIRAKTENRPYADYADYVAQKREKRGKSKYFFLTPFLSIGLALMLAALVMRGVFGAQTGI